ncbi:SMI1/KNR4 family protein [Loktanella sp. TSTF-M6]|uniref:SMI1/KNR4 family protein n=1 Tax=Loktanella gaetbuli TaxID=2881335 RepID=A0ABS8BXP1_9RHOB|nr:SMI1/KNR4 family protein [Loktanella gaetbuli]MCB5200516.1 SMI1/KNR4 family protein [Loktanella gaetbuli]
MALDQNIKLEPKSLEQGEHRLTGAETEQALGHTLPRALIDLLDPIKAPAFFNGSVRIKVEECNPLTDKEGRQNVLMLFGLTLGKDGILAKYQNYNGRFARRCIPFAEDGLGNLFVIDAVSGQVKFWYHECIDGETSPKALTLVAEDFDSFISGLEPFEEAQNPAPSSGIKRFRFDF